MAELNGSSYGGSDDDGEEENANTLLYTAGKQTRAAHHLQFIYETMEKDDQPISAANTENTHVDAADAAAGDPRTLNSNKAFLDHFAYKLKKAPQTVKDQFNSLKDSRDKVVALFALV